MLITFPAVTKRSSDLPDHEVIDHCSITSTEESLCSHTTWAPYDISVSNIDGYRSLSG